MQLKKIDNSNDLTEYDIESALEAYDKEYFNFTISDIEKLTDVRIKRNKRNGRTQKQHLIRARVVQNVDYPNGSWRNVNGRPSKKEMVINYRKSNPEHNPTQIAKALNISRVTVYKYYNN